VDASDKLFAGSIPEIYDRYLVPLIFEPYAVNVAARINKIAPSHVLETAAGTGVLTRAMAAYGWSGTGTAFPGAQVPVTTW
jgi:hypothetical protein